MNQLVAQVNLGALPPDVAQRVKPALSAGASIGQTHDAASALANECPPTALHAVFLALLLMSNPSVRLECAEEGAQA